MTRVIFMDDILFHNIDFKQKGVMPLHKILINILKSALPEDVTITYQITNEKNESFSREYFYKLGNVQNANFRYNAYNIATFNKEQLDYLKSFFYDKPVIIGFELYSNFSDLLSSFGCKVIDFAFHSYKLLDDMTYGVFTNDKNVYHNLLKYKVPQDKFYFYANYWKVFMECNNMIKDDDLDDNSVLFIGQTLLDKSVEKDGKFLNVTHFEEKLKELSEQYSKIYYLPHPYLGKHRKIIYDFCKKSPYIELLSNRSTYGLLASDKIKKVVGISTSVLYEAQYFNKEVEYLYKPLFNIDVPFEEHSYVSIYEDYWNPKFWADILSPICEVKQNVPDVNYFKGTSNKMRNINNMYWGYAQLDPIRRIPNFEQSVKNLYLKYIAPLF